MVGHLCSVSKSIVSYSASLSKYHVLTCETCDLRPPIASRPTASPDCGLCSTGSWGLQSEYFQPGWRRVPFRLCVAAAVVLGMRISPPKRWQVAVSASLRGVEGKGQRVDVCGGRMRIRDILRAVYNARLGDKVLAHTRRCRASALTRPRPSSDTQISGGSAGRALAAPKKQMWVKAASSPPRNANRTQCSVH